MVNLRIDGKIVQAREGEMLLAVIKRQGIEIPAQCQHEAIEPAGNCRLCMVEITRKEWDGWKKCVTSCLYPVEDGLIVETHNDKLFEIRKTILDLQLARSPHSEYLQKMAEEYGLEKSSYPIEPDGDNCIMCYACVRICELLGKSAISPTQRGHNKIIAGPFGETPPDCIGCLSCAHICPTDHIKWNDEGDIRTIWDKSFDLISCKKCGEKTITREFADYLIEKRALPANYFDICDKCKRQDTAGKMGSLVIKAREAAI
jgi:bidirectional [NiFe] hydrogenase diaphorase subunit